ncbi:MAG: hypothetical protein MUF33_02095 [Candidatus Nanopelagicales bacterium]|jgi:hypothetical protein|nr:hypothetical protein [Candidatus Nanopelagicales bacterium]
MTCLTNETRTVAICRPGATKVIAAERVEPRWCFGCRKRLGGTLSCVAEVEPSYYDPWWQYACDGCGQDRRWGFGGGPL